MENIATKQDQEIVENLKKLTSEQKKQVMFVVDWLSTASKAETKKFAKIMASQDKKVIEAFVESIKTGGATI